MRHCSTAADIHVCLSVCLTDCLIGSSGSAVGDGICVLSAFLGSSSPASLQGYTPYNYHHIHPAAAAAGHHHHHHHMMPPAPISAREAKQQAIITQSAHSQLVSRPHLQTGNKPSHQSTRTRLLGLQSTQLRYIYWLRVDPFLSA